ncbi:MAG TPA: aminomethyl-transferring glycine dehydrogenase subunit GcvPB [Candidatus Omnitrophota bacterium]|nr:aminomethyl-transferring glycine dehydrogenase subunit GcvPB [Candidatus Omnitrophota bacterium]
MQLIYEKSVSGRKGFSWPQPDIKNSPALDSGYCRAQQPDLPEASELDVVRHFSNLARLNFSVDTNFYPLGSCTMKYNPKFTEKIAVLPGFTDVHPLLPQLLGGGMLTQGSLEVIYKTKQLLCEITGMDAFTTQPMAGAHGELTGVMLMAAYHKHKGNRRKTVLIPDSAHGTNPASAAIAGYSVEVIPTDKDGRMDMQALKNKLTANVAGIMMTCPDTLGLFNPHIKEICDLAHSVDALVYYDGANLNAILGKCRPGDIGFDIVHLNLHKTFGTPHGGGGPGSGPVGVVKRLEEFLPIPRIVRRTDGTFALEYQRKLSIGYIAPFYGNFAVVLKTYAYIMLLGRCGLIEASERAVLNANYCRVQLKEYFDIAYDRICMHECVFSATRQKQYDVSALDIAKYLIDQGIHPPTIYFPLIVKEAIMIEPTESESKQTLDRFIEIMKEAARLAKADPAKIKEAPLTTPVKRLDETKAAKDLNLRWKKRVAVPQA